MNHLNRYATLCRHKRKMRKSHMIQYGHGRDQNIKLFADRLREEHRDRWWRTDTGRNGGYEYWQKYSMTGRRQFAKRYSDKRIRQKYRQMIHHVDPDDVCLPQRADYEKEFDYSWTIW